MVINSIAPLVFILVMIVGLGISAVIFNTASQGVGVLIGVISFLIASFLSNAVKIAAQWEKAIVLRLGKFKNLKGPGIFFIIPVIEQTIIIDIRILTQDIPKQQVITKDNVPVTINGVLYFKVAKVDDAIIKVQNYNYAIAQYAQTALRDVVGSMTLDQLLAERQQIGEEIEKIVEKESENWGLEVTGIRIQDIDMPEELKKMMSRQASAEREKRANITKAEGDKLAAVNLAAAAATMLTSPGAMQLRTLQTIDGLGPTPSNTVIVMLPVETIDALRAYAASKKVIEENK